MLLKPIFIGYKVAITAACGWPQVAVPISVIGRGQNRPSVLAQEMIHEPYRYRRRYPDGLFLGP
ncbi:hypothetical protein PS691_03314 [Pseudomonas fluorescens]|uniref:Uncharacterized protein n=1 Tax=Pseudomonas fluorescens TaxID=294 RepID=A0A5E7DDB4_PSEFL|nr:hypothetical protein PS691_03314 [Pseudomonas fluorescens]